MLHRSSTAPDGAFFRLDCGAIGIDGFASPFGAEVSALAGRPVSAERLVDQLKAVTEGSLPPPFEEMIETIVELKVSPSETRNLVLITPHPTLDIQSLLL